MVQFVDILNLNKNCISHFTKQLFSKTREPMCMCVWLCMCECGPACRCMWIRGQMLLNVTLLALYSVQVVWNTVPETLLLCPNQSYWFQITPPCWDLESITCMIGDDAVENLALSTCSVFSESIKYMFASLMNRRWTNSPILPSEEFFDVMVLRTKAGVNFLFFLFLLDCLIYLVPLAKTNLEVERVSHCEKKISDFF